LLLWATETGLNPIEILRAQTEGELTVPEIVAQGNNLDVLQNLWKLLEELLLNPNSEDKNG